MKLKNIFLVLFICIFSSLTYSKDTKYKKGELLVKFTSKISANSVLSKRSFTQMNMKVIKHFKHLGVYLISYNDPSRSDKEVLSNLLSDNNIRIAQFNHRVTLRSTIPDDEYFENQWNLYNTGQTGGTAGADISANEAWDIATNINGTNALGDSIIVSVIDGGFDLDHEDLNFTDMVYNVALESDDPEDMPTENHGTAIAGIIGAHGNNETGVSGIGWNNKVFPIGNTFAADTLIYEDRVVASYDYVLGLRKQYDQSNGQQGAFIVATNSSFGLGAYGFDPANHQVWCDSYDSLGVHGILNVAATANYNVDIDEVEDVPTSCSSDYLIAVTNTDHNDNRYSDGAAWGDTTIDLGAPGTEIFTTIIGGYDNRYGGWPITGTSVATPHVVGTIALIYSMLPADLLTYYKTHPSEAPLDIKEAILNSVDPNSSLEDITVSGGRLNVYNALKYIIANYGANLGDGIDEVAFYDPITIEEPGIKITLCSDLVLYEDINFASGASLIFNANNTVNISSASGTVTIGGAGASAKLARKDHTDNNELSEESDELRSSTSVPYVFNLSQNYPNPFNSQTYIMYELPEALNVRLEIFDILGRRVAVLIHKNQEAGTYKVKWDAKGQASGLYTCRLQAGDFIKNKQMILIK